MDNIVNRTHLMYNQAEDNYVTRAELAHCVTPPPMGPLHNPYPFSTYVDDVHAVLDMNGIAVAREEYAVTKDDNRLFGLMQLEPREGEYISADEWSYLLALRGSHDQTMARGLALGTRVIVCSNLCFNGDLATLTTKQTTHIADRIYRMLHQALDQLPEQIAAQAERFERYKNHALTSQAGDSGLVEVYMRGGLSASQLGRAIQEWREPSYDDHAAHGWTAWRFLQACTQACKPTGSRTNMDIVRHRTSEVSQFLNEQVGLALPKAA